MDEPVHSCLTQVVSYLPDGLVIERATPAQTPQIPGLRFFDALPGKPDRLRTADFRVVSEPPERFEGVDDRIIRATPAVVPGDPSEFVKNLICATGGAAEETVSSGRLTELYQCAIVRAKTRSYFLRNSITSQVCQLLTQRCRLSIPCSRAHALPSSTMRGERSTPSA